MLWDYRSLNTTKCINYLFREENLSLYHTIIPVKQLKLSFDSAPHIVEKYKSESQFKSLLDDVALNGITDPCLVQAYPDRLQMETGCQRLLAVRQLGIPALECFVYPWQGGIVQNFDLKLTAINDVEHLRKYFRHTEVSSYLDILGYLSTGRIQF